MEKINNLNSLKVSPVLNLAFGRIISKHSTFNVSLSSFSECSQSPLFLSPPQKNNKKIYDETFSLFLRRYGYVKKQKQLRE